MSVVQLMSKTPHRLNLSPSLGKKHRDKENIHPVQYQRLILFNTSGSGKYPVFILRPI